MFQSTPCGYNGGPDGIRTRTRPSTQAHSRLTCTRSCTWRNDTFHGPATRATLHCVTARKTSGEQPSSNPRWQCGILVPTAISLALSDAGAFCPAHLLRTARDLSLDDPRRHATSDVCRFASRDHESVHGNGPCLTLHLAYAPMQGARTPQPDNPGL